ncbi:hypothetical protein D1007_45487 [Hordeum vulgare]|nr:hypothetical protein D1007_45487 [Hordeum vulgare]
MRFINPAPLHTSSHRSMPHHAPSAALAAALSYLCSPCCHRATMPLRRRESLGYRGVREHPSDTFYAEIVFDNMRLGLVTLDTTDKDAPRVRCGGVAPLAAS